MRQTVLVDVDETILSYSDAFQLWLERRGYRSHRRLRDRYEIGETFGITEREAVDLVMEFGTLPEFGRLRAEPDAMIVVEDMRSRGARFVAVTAVPQAFHDARRANLEAEFGFEWEVHCVGIRGDKVDVLSRFEPSVFVDDHAVHAVAGAQAGHRSFLIDRDHNRHCDDPRVVRVRDWFRIREILEADLDR